MSSKTKFDMGASAKNAALSLVHAEEAELSSAKFKLAFSQEIATAKRAGVKNWGGARYSGSYGKVIYDTLTAAMWPKAKDSDTVLPNEQIGDDVLKPLVKRRENLMLVGKICFEQEIALVHLNAKRLQEDTKYDLFTGDVKGASAKSNEEPKTKGAQATKTTKHLGYALAPFINHPEVVKFLGTVSAELRAEKTLDGSTIQKALLKVALKEKLLQDKDGDIKAIK